MSVRPAYLVAALAAVAPGLAAAGSSYGDGAFETVVRDTERGVRAAVRYFPEVMIGGEEEIVNEDGTTAILNWDGFTGLFEAELLEDMRLDATAAAGFLLEAIPVVCPSADMAAIQSSAEVRVNGRFIAIYGQCPAVDAKVSR